MSVVLLSCHTLTLSTVPGYPSLNCHALTLSTAPGYPSLNCRSYYSRGRCCEAQLQSFWLSMVLRLKFMDTNGDLKLWHDLLMEGLTTLYRSDAMIVLDGLTYLLPKVIGCLMRLLVSSMICSNLTKFYTVYCEDGSRPAAALHSH